MSEYFALIKANTKVIVIVIMLGILSAGAVYTKHWYDNKITVSYQKGVKDTDEKWTLVVQQVKDNNQKFKDDQQKSVDKLNEELEEQRKRSNDLQSKLAQKSKDYANSQNGKSKSLDDDFVDIYNESLGLQ